MRLNALGRLTMNNPARAQLLLRYVAAKLAATGGNKSRAATILGIERKTLYRKLERMGL